MNTEKELQKKVNPVFNTAVTTLALKAAAGLKRAGEVYTRLGLTNAPQSDDGPDDLTRLCFIAIHDMRHEAVDRMIDETSASFVFDLPCGYTHRALDIADKGKYYIGGDLPAVISEIKPVIEAMADDTERQRIRFAEVDVTDPDLMLNAVKDVTGEVCIATEGLTVYLNSSELALLAENIAKILSKTGGCWLLTDPETLAYYMAVITSIAGERSQEVLAYAAKSFSAQSDTDILSSAAALENIKKSDSSNLHGGVDYDALKEIYEKFGFKIEKIPYYREDLELSVFKMMPPDAVARMKEAMKKINVWKFTLKDNLVFDDKPKNTYSKEGFSVTTETVGTTLNMRLSGRIDTVTAPEFLAAWENESKTSDISAVKVDCTDMEYISSAGLRVLMMINKAIPEPPLVITGARPDVREIFETTGFIDIFKLV